MKKTEDEIQKAHDVFIAILNGEVKIDISENDKMVLAASCDVLCWMLGHDHNKNFERNLQAIYSEAGNNGYFISKKDDDNLN